LKSEVRDGPFDPYAELARYRREHPGLAPACGGEAVFIGSMRDHNEGARVLAMELEHYPGMTRFCLDQIGNEARERYGVADVCVVHRVGRIVPGEAIVLVAAWAAHRAAALAACQYLIEQLKTRAPFWKKEFLADGSTRWVERNTPAAADSSGHAA